MTNRCRPSGSLSIAYSMVHGPQHVAFVSHDWFASYYVGRLVGATVAADVMGSIIQVQRPLAHSTRRSP